MSSGESELYACVKACAEGLGVTAGLADLGVRKQLTIGLDSSAALGVVRRVGLSKLRHIDTKYLWVQQARKEGRFTVYKVDGKLNKANLMTKHMGKEQLESDMKACNLKVLDGRHPKALKLQIDLHSMSKASLLLLMVAVPTASGLNEMAVYRSSDSNTGAGIPTCVLMMIGVMLLSALTYHLGKDLGVARGRHLEKVETKKKEAEAKAQADNEEVETKKKDAEAKAQADKQKKEMPDDQGQQPRQRRGREAQEDIFIAPLRGERWHTSRFCGGLREARDVKKFTPCGTCSKHLAIGNFRG